jgi:hypothetical protein
MKRMICVLASVSMLGACAYNAPVTASPNLNVYSSYGDKLPGDYALYIDTGEFGRTIHPTGYLCSAHSYPLDIRDPFRESVVGTLQQLVEHVDVVQTPLTADELAKSGKRGQIIVRADSMTATVQFLPGFWSSTGEGHVELTANLTVDGVGGRLLGTTGEGEGTAQADAGAMCGGGAQALANAAEKAVKQLLGQLGERLSNAPRLREAASAAASK